MGLRSIRTEVIPLYMQFEKDFARMDALDGCAKSNAILCIFITYKKKKKNTVYLYPIFI